MVFEQYCQTQMHYLSDNLPMSRADRCSRCKESKRKFAIAAGGIDSLIGKAQAEPTAAAARRRLGRQPASTAKPLMLLML
jgi:hypothetical protein